MFESQSFTSLIVVLGAATAMIIALYFVPALIELKKPRDASPRVIFDVGARTLSLLKTPLTDIQADWQLTLRLNGSTDFLSSIPNMEN